MNPETTTYDIAIIGSGITGSTLGAILARHGLRVILFEAGIHPKFAIGESTILETSETLRAIAEFFDVPEAAHFSSENFLAYAGSTHGIKRHFAFTHHTAGQAQNPRHVLEAVIPKAPYGHELHIYRQDSDSYLTSIAISYGAQILQKTTVQDIRLAPEGVTVVTDRGEFEAQYVVDAGGFRSILAERFGLRDTAMRSHSRAIFTHMIDVPCFNDVRAATQEYGIPFRLSEGTLHHIFEGGWLWVIPFNNHPDATNPLCSVGLMLDPRVHPPRADLSPEEEFWDFVEQYPSMAAQLRPAKPVRDWTRTGRIQYTSKQVVGDRYTLLGHAAGFVDPLYSKGLYISFMGTVLLAHLLLEAHETGDYSAARFRPLEELTLAYVDAADRLVANSFKSWGNVELWNVYAVLWLLGAYLEYVKLTSARLRAADRQSYIEEVLTLRLVGGGYQPFEQLADQVDAIVEAVDMADETDVAAAVAEIRRLYATVDYMPDAFRDLLAGKNHLPVRKVRLKTLKPGEGFLRRGQYRQHFFGANSAADLARRYLREQIRYSRPALNRQRSRRARLTT